MRHWDDGPRTRAVADVEGPHVVSHVRADLSQVVFLVRHGHALAADLDPTRPLSSTGRTRVDRMGLWLLRLGAEPAEILHSGKPRARETAERLASMLEIPTLRREEGLAPNDDPHPLAGALQADRRSLAVVGHLPFLERLASVLLVGDVDRLRVHWPDAGVLVLGRTESSFRLVSMVSPEELPPAVG